MQTWEKVEVFKRPLTFFIEKFMCVIFCFFVYVLFGVRFAHLEFSVYEAVIILYTGYVLQRYKSDELKALHKVIFSRVGKTTMIKKNLRKFNGFDFDKESDQFEKKKHVVQK